MQSCPVRVIARVRREAPGAPSSSCLLVQPTRLIVQPFVAALASAAGPGASADRFVVRFSQTFGGIVLRAFFFSNFPVPCRRDAAHLTGESRESGVAGAASGGRPGFFVSASFSNP
jgi:hypothetical protein